jgi:hypothetical protein
MKVRLNGWQRLWVILSFVYLLLVVGVTILFWPTPEGMWHRDEFLAMMPADLRVGVEAAYTSGWKWEETTGKRNVVVWDYAPTEASKQKSVSPPPAAGYRPLPDSVSEPVRFPNRAVLEIRPKDGDTQYDARVAAAYWAVVESANRTERWTRLWEMALVWLVPCLALYACGWGIAWVRRGFAKA